MLQIPEDVAVLQPVAVRIPTAAKMLDCSPTTIWKLCKAGRLETIKVNSDDRVTVASIRRLAGAAA